MSVGEGWLNFVNYAFNVQPSTKQKSTNIHYKVIIVSLKNCHGFQLSNDSLLDMIGCILVNLWTY